MVMGRITRVQNFTNTWRNLEEKLKSMSTAYHLLKQISIIAIVKSNQGKLAGEIFPLYSGKK